jgi:opacity protein-like surface antigen
LEEKKMRKFAMVVAALACLSLMAFSAVAATAPAAEDMKGKISFTLSGGFGMPMGKLGEDFDTKILTGTPVVTLVPAADPDPAYYTLDYDFPVSDSTAGVGGGQKAAMDFGFGVDYFLTNNIAIGVDVSMLSTKMKDVTLKYVDETAFYAGDAGSGESTGVLTYVDVKAVELLKAKTLQYGIHGKYLITTGGPIAPFVQLGFGMYNRKIEGGTLGGEAIKFGPKEDQASLSDTKPGMNVGFGADYKVNEMIRVGLSGTYHMTFGKFEQDVTNSDDAVVKETLLKNWSYATINLGVTFFMPASK